MVPRRRHLPRGARAADCSPGRWGATGAAGRTTWAGEVPAGDRLGDDGEGTDWQRPPRQMIGTAYWYTHTDQWRYDGYRADALTSPLARGHLPACTPWTRSRCRRGWAGCRPTRSSTATPSTSPTTPRRRAGPVAAHVAEQLRDGTLRSRSRTRTRRRTGRAASRCGGRTCWAPRPRATSTSSSTCSAPHDNLRADQTPPDRRPRDVTWRDEATRGQARPAAVAGLPDDQLHAAVRHRAPGRDLVREARPEHHRHAPVRARLQPGDRPTVRVAHRLRRLPRHRPAVQRAGPRPPRGPPRRRRRAAAARHARRDGAARWPGPGLAGRRGRAGPGTHDAELRGRRARLPGRRGQDGRASARWSTGSG